MSAAKPIYRLDDIEVDPSRGSLTRGGRELYLRQQAFQVLLYLLDERQRLVTKEELIHGIWRDSTITDKALMQCVADISNVLGDDVHHPRFIRTFPKIGYRFIGPVEERFIGDTQAGNASSSASATKNPIPSSESRPFLNSTEYLAFLPGQPRLAPSQGPSTGTSSRFRFSRKIAVIAGLLILLIIGSVAGWRIARSFSRPAVITIPQVPGKKSIIVMFLANRSGTDLNRDELTELLINDLSLSDKLIVLKRPQLYSLLSATGHRASDNLGLQDALSVARQSKAQAAIVGTVSGKPDHNRLTTQLFDLDSGNKIAEESITIRNANELPTQMGLLTSKLSGHLNVLVKLDATPFYSLGKSKAQAGENENAVELLKLAVQQDPDSAMAYAWIGYVYGVNGIQPDKGQQYLDKALDLDKTRDSRNRLSPEERLTVTGWSQIAHQDYTGAIKTFRQMTAVYPRQPEGYERLGLLLLGEEQPDEAIKVLNQGLSLNPEAENLYGALGTVYLTIGNYDYAVKAGRRVVELAAKEPGAHESLARALQRVGLYDEAASEYKKAIALDPDYKKANLRLGDFYVQQGQYANAIVQYKGYIDSADSDFARAIGWGRIADVYVRKGDLANLEEAASNEAQFHNGSVWHLLIVVLEKGDKEGAAKLQPIVFDSLPYPQPGARKDQRSAYYYRGYTALKSGQRNEAIANFKTALRHLPSVLDVDTHEDCLGRAYLEIGEADEAITEFNRILQLNPNYPLAHYYLGQAFDLRGDKDRAANEYEAFLQLWSAADPDVPEVRTAREQLSK